MHKKYPRVNFSVPLNFKGHHYLGVSLAPGVNLLPSQPMPCVTPARSRLTMGNNDVDPNVFVDLISSPGESLNCPEGYLPIEAVEPFVPPMG